MVSSLDTAVRASEQACHATAMHSKTNRQTDATVKSTADTLTLLSLYCHASVTRDRTALTDWIELLCCCRPLGSHATTSSAIRAERTLYKCWYAVASITGEHVGTSFSLLKCLTTHYGRRCEPFSGLKCTKLQDLRIQSQKFSRGWSPQREGAIPFRTHLQNGPPCLDPDTNFR